MSSGKYVEIAARAMKFFGSSSNWNRITGQCRLIAAEKDKVKVEFTVTEPMTNSAETLHGGCTASLVDMITTVAILTHDTNKNPGVSVNMNVSYCRGAKLGETVIMDAFVEKRGRSLAFTRANMYTKEGKLVAYADHIKALGPPVPFSVE